MSLLAMNSLYNEKGQWPAPMDRGKNIHAVCWEDNYFPKGKFKLFYSLFHSVYLVFSIRLISIADLFAVCYLWNVSIDDKCCVVTHRAADIIVGSLGLLAWLAYLACLRSHVLRVYCNFESKQAISITLFGRCAKNKWYQFETSQPPLSIHKSTFLDSWMDSSKSKLLLIQKQ